MAEIPFGTVLLGAEGFNVGNVNDTYRGEVLTEDGRVRNGIIKDLAPVQLCNELIAYSLACELELPIPDCCLGLVRPGILDVRHGPSIATGERLVFVSVDVKVPNLTYRIRNTDDEGRLALRDEIADWPDLSHLYAYDTWVANVDRHPGNLLFGGKEEVWLIDHGHCFTGESWQPSHLVPSAEYRNRLSEWLTPELSVGKRKDKAKEANALGSTLGSVDTGRCCDESRVTNILPSDYVDALKAFLNNRTGVVGKQASKALGAPVLV